MILESLNIRFNIKTKQVKPSFCSIPFIRLAFFHKVVYQIQSVRFLGTDLNRNLLTFLLLPVSREGFSFITALLLRHLPAHLFIHVVGDLVRLLLTGLPGYLTTRLIFNGAAVVINTG